MAPWQHGIMQTRMLHDFQGAKPWSNVFHVMALQPGAVREDWEELFERFSFWWTAPGPHPFTGGFHWCGGEPTQLLALRGILPPEVELADAIGVAVDYFLSPSHGVNGGQAGNVAPTFDWSTGIGGRGRTPRTCLGYLDDSLYLQPYQDQLDPSVVAEITATYLQLIDVISAPTVSGRLFSLCCYRRAGRRLADGTVVFGDPITGGGFRFPLVNSQRLRLTGRRRRARLRGR